MCTIVSDCEERRKMIKYNETKEKTCLIYILTRVPIQVQTIPYPPMMQVMALTSYHVQRIMQTSVAVDPCCRPWSVD